MGEDDIADGTGFEESEGSPPGKAPWEDVVITGLNELLKPGTVPRDWVVVVVVLVTPVMVVTGSKLLLFRSATNEDLPGCRLPLMMLMIPSKFPSTSLPLPGWDTDLSGIINPTVFAGGTGKGFGGFVTAPSWA